MEEPPKDQPRDRRRRRAEVALPREVVGHAVGKLEWLGVERRLGAEVLAP